MCKNIFILLKRAVRVCTDYIAHCGPLFVKNWGNDSCWFVSLLFVHTKIKLPTLQFGNNIHSHNTRHNIKNRYVTFMLKFLNNKSIIHSFIHSIVIFSYYFTGHPNHWVILHELPLDVFK